MVLTQASVGILDRSQIELFIRLVINKQLQCIARFTRLELDGLSIAHFLKTQVGVGKSKLISIFAVRSDDKCSITTVPLSTVAELDFAIPFTFAIGASHAPPLLFALLLPEISIFPVES